MPTPAYRGRRLTVTMPDDVFDYVEQVATKETRTNSQAALVLIQEGIASRETRLGDSPRETAIAKSVPELQPRLEPAQTKVAPKGVETPQAFKFRVRDNYFQLMNNARLTPTRLKELALGETPTKAEIEKVERVLADQDLNAE